MGSRLAARLVQAGYPVTVYNRTRDKTDPLLAQGANRGEGPAALAAQVQVRFTVLADPPAVREMALGETGFLDHLRPESIWVDCSTVDPAFSCEMAEQARRRALPGRAHRREQAHAGWWLPISPHPLCPPPMGGGKGTVGVGVSE